MSLYGALFSGVSGLQAQSSAMGAIADNVTNVNTIGYKATTVHFQTLVTKQASLTAYSAGGVQSKPRADVDVQGLLQSTSSSTDVGISGDGFFIVNENSAPTSGSLYAYTRAGSFKVDKQGFLQNSAGYYLQGWPLKNWDGTAAASQVAIGTDTFMKAYTNSSGDTTYINDNSVDSLNLQPLNLNSVGGTAEATGSVSLGAQLPSGAVVGNTEQASILMYDSLGNSHNLLHTFTKRAQNAWDLQIVPPAGSEYITVDDQTSARQVYFSAGRLDFSAVPDNGTSMTFSPDGGTTSFTVAFTNNDTVNMVNDTLTVTNAGIADGETISLTLNGQTFTFEFDTNSAVTSGNIQVTKAGTDDLTAANLAAALENVMDAQLGDGTWAAAAGAGGVVNFANDTGGTMVGGFVDGTGGAVVAAINGGAPASTTLNINVTGGRSLSLVMDELADRVNQILTWYNADTPESPPTRWAERVAGESAITFNQGSTANSINVNASGATASGSAVVTQNTAFTVPALSAAVAWTSTANYFATFNGDGTPDKFFGTDEATEKDPKPRIRIGWANGANDMDGSSNSNSAISAFYGNYNATDGLTQFAGDYQINSVSQNGAAFGNFAGVSIGEGGIVTALFDNGVTRPVFMIPVATFVNPNGMEAIAGNVYIETDFSGQPTIREPGSGGAGSTASSTLEASTVDIGEEFTSMITTQRAYSASTKIISTADEMLDELMRVKR